MVSDTEKLTFTIDQVYIRRLLDEMIEINSVIGNEKDLALYLAQEVQKLGLAIQLEDVESNRPNLYAHHSFSDDGKTLTLNGHLDTVNVYSGWSTDPFIPIEKDGKLYGLGSADMKAGIACELGAIKALLDSNESLTGSIHFTAVVDEEGYGLGAKKMLENPFFGKGRTDGVVITEPFFGNTDLRSLPLGMSGKILYKITVQGKSAHAFRPEDGINAVDDASRFITALMQVEGKTKDHFSLPVDAEFGAGSVCVLKISGGYKSYSVVVPDACEIILNRLLVPGETKDSAVKDLELFIASLKLRSDFKIEIISPFYLPYRVNKDEPILTALETAYKEVIGTQPLYGYKNMITDANTFTGEGNIPAVVFGPKGENLHGANEYVELASLEPVAKTLCQTFVEFQKTAL